MTPAYNGEEKRLFLRFDFENPVHYKVIDPSEDENPITSFIKAMSRNLSAAGIFFMTQTQHVPEMYSLIMLDINCKIAAICQELEQRALIINDKLLGRVVRIENNPDGTCGVGVAFITKTDPLSDELKKRTQ